MRSNRTTIFVVGFHRDKKVPIKSAGRDSTSFVDIVVGQTLGWFSKLIMGVTNTSGPPYP